MKYCVKGSHKTGEEFEKEILQMKDLSDCISIDLNYPRDHNFEKEVDFLKKLRTDNPRLNYVVHGQFYSGSLNDFNEQIRKETINELFRNIDTAKEIGARIVVLHPGLEPYGLKLDKRVELELDSYRQIANYAQKGNIKIGLENEAKTCFWFPDRAAKLELIVQTIRNIGMKNFGLTLDVGHANVSQEDYIGAIKKYSDIIFHVHAHDNFGGPEENMAKCNRPDPHLTIGKGRIDWNDVIHALDAVNYPGYLEIECNPNELEYSLRHLSDLK